VTRAHRYEPLLNATYQEMATHYGVAVLPARAYKPRDKAKIEVGVLIAERWIMARLRNRTFFSLVELNLAIRELVEWLNNRPFKKMEGCRRSLFEELERPVMQPTHSRQDPVRTNSRRCGGQALFQRPLSRPPPAGRRVTYGNVIRA
jgi:transposase